MHGRTTACNIEYNKFRVEPYFCTRAVRRTEKRRAQYILRTCDHINVDHLKIQQIHIIDQSH